MSYELRTALPLPLFMTRVLAYYPYDALALDDPAFIANFTN
jgi:hypothetical protein